MKYVNDSFHHNIQKPMVKKYEPNCVKISGISFRIMKRSFQILTLYPNLACHGQLKAPKFTNITLIDHKFVKPNKKRFCISYCHVKNSDMKHNHGIIWMKITATSLKIVGNIHPNLNHSSKLQDVTANNKYQELRLLTFIYHTPLKK